MPLIAKTPATLSDPTQIAHLRLARSRRVGPVTFSRLIADHGDPQAALEALPQIAAVAGVRDYAPCSAEAARSEYERGVAAGATLLFIGQLDYPKSLGVIPDPPPVLWAKGDLSLLQRAAIAVVGARNASSLGARMARLLAVEIGDFDYVIVSGLARGIDRAAHEASVKSGTIAVLAGGIDVIYPVENGKLAADIAKSGLMVTEQMPGLQPLARHFPVRNRIIAGLSRAVVVVEGAARSGSLITARAALDQGRDVMAVPGHPLDGRATGCNTLIRDGATLVRSGSDVMAALGGAAQKDPAPEPPRPTASPSPTHNAGARLLNLLATAPVAEDVLIRELHLSAQTVSQLLLELELQGLIERQSGGLVAAAATQRPVAATA